MANDVKITPNHRRIKQATCIRCGKEFTSSLGRILCSDECKIEHERKLQRANYEKRMNSGCVICGNSLKSIHGSSTTCSALCLSIKRARERERLLNQMRDRRPIPSWLAQLDTPEAARLRDAIKRSEML